MKPCPFCAEDIQDEAVKCKHCGEFLSEEARAAAGQTALPWFFRTSYIIISILCVGPLALPMIWWKPNLHPAWKVLWTIVISVVSYYSYLHIMSVIEKYDELIRKLL